MWFAFTENSCIADADTKKELIEKIRKEDVYRIKKLSKGFYLYEDEDTNESSWRKKYYLCGSVKIAENNGFKEQLKTYLRQV